MSSGRLFRSECFSAFRMCSFSVRQRLHRLDSLLYIYIYIYIYIYYITYIHTYIHIYIHTY